MNAVNTKAYMVCNNGWVSVFQNGNRLRHSLATQYDIDISQAVVDALNRGVE